MTNLTTNAGKPSHSEVAEAARQARAEAFRRWMSTLCTSLMNLFGTTEWEWRAWRRE